MTKTPEDNAPATKRDVRAAVAELRAEMATKDELQSAVAEIRAEMATKSELANLEQRMDAKFDAMTHFIKEQADETRRHFDVVAENIHKDVAGAAADATTLLNNQIPDHEERITDLEKQAGLPAGPRFQHLG